MKRTIYNVSSCNSPEDSGCTVSFESREKAQACYDWLVGLGTWHVKMWTC